MKYLILVLMVGLLAGCGKATDTTSASNYQTDPLLKTWVHADSNAFNFLLLADVLNVSTRVNWPFDVGGDCSSMAIITETVAGVPSAGSMTTTGSMQASATAPPSNCSTFDDSWTWTITAGVMTLCGQHQSGCWKFQ